MRKDNWEPKEAAEVWIARYKDQQLQTLFIHRLVFLTKFSRFYTNLKAKGSPRNDYRKSWLDVHRTHFFPFGSSWESHLTSQLAVGCGQWRDSSLIAVPSRNNTEYSAVDGLSVSISPHPRFRELCWRWGRKNVRASMLGAELRLLDIACLLQASPHSSCNYPHQTFIIGSTQ